MGEWMVGWMSGEWVDRWAMNGWKEGWMDKIQHSYSLGSSAGTNIITNLNARGQIQPLIQQMGKWMERNVPRATQLVTDRTRIKAQVY